MLRRRLCASVPLGWTVWRHQQDGASDSSSSTTAIPHCYHSYWSPSSTAFASTQFASKRGLKTLDVREYRPLATPIEFRFYQRYANHPNRQSGVQFLTHYDTHQRFRVRKDYIDYMFWGKEQGQARLPHRHHRVAFDFFDKLHPTVAPGDTHAYFAGQDPTAGPHPDISSEFDPCKKVFSHPEHWNKMFSKRRPGEGDIRLGAVESKSLLHTLARYSDTSSPHDFHLNNGGHSNGKTPGVNTQFLGETDRKMMQAMSVPLTRDNTLTANDGRFSKAIYINNPKGNQTLSASMASQLNVQLDRATNAVYSKLVVLESAQSGLTDYFCGGVDFNALGFDLAMCGALREKAKSLLDANKEGGSTDREVQELLSTAMRYEDRVDDCLRQHAALLWRVYTAPRPFMTLTNGKCRGTGCGVSLLSKYAATKDSTEYIFDGPNIGLTPYGGLTRLLARPETSLKFPGLAEFVTLTGTSLFAGDALRLGWTDLFTSIPDMGYHIKEWFNSTEHMHNDAIAWQLGHLLDSCFRLKDVNSSAMERSAITAIRARWIEDAFADQPSVKNIIKTLGEIEKLPFSSHHNTKDACQATPYSLESVEDGVARLEQTQLKYTLAPWDVSPVEASVPIQQVSEVFTSYVLERRGAHNVVVNKDRQLLANWNAQRQAEYHAYKALQAVPCPRHVFVRLEGCEGKLIDFEFDFFRPTHVGALRDPNDEDAVSSAVLDALRTKVLDALGMPLDRDVELGWYLPTLDTCPMFNDEQLQQVLHADPGIENPHSPTKYPPLYLIAKRNTLYFSEWAYAVKHQLLLQSPFALSATFQMLQQVRGDGSEEAVQSTSEALSTEFQYVSRLVRRPDFYKVGQHTLRSTDEWDDIKEERARNIHKASQPLRALPDFEEVFERDVEIEGHKFLLRPRWSPRTLDEVQQADIMQLQSPLDFEKDGTTALNVPTYSSKLHRIDYMLDDAGGPEIVNGLGEASSNVKPLVGNAHVPKNVNFYEMARHPWNDTPTSWRQDGYTEGSMQYFTEQYKLAESALYDENAQGAQSYWPSKKASEGVTNETETQALLNERLYDVIHDAEKSVEPWARNLRKQATHGKLEYKMEVATQKEKIYDDEYYRWFIQPGVNPNPSGLLVGRSNAFASSEDSELDKILNDIVSNSGLAGGDGRNEGDFGSTEFDGADDGVNGSEDVEE